MSALGESFMSCSDQKKFNFLASNPLLMRFPLFVRLVPKMMDRPLLTFFQLGKNSQDCAPLRWPSRSQGHPHAKKRQLVSPIWWWNLNKTEKTHRFWIKKAACISVHFICKATPSASITLQYPERTTQTQLVSWFIRGSVNSTKEMTWD